jgi:hypothetical protein
MHLDIELCLQSRQPDRVVVRLKLVPQADEGVQVDGAAVDLLSREGDALCPRVLLPFAGLLRAPITTTVELRGRTSVEDGAQVVAVAWCGTEQVQSSLPTDPFVDLREHLRAGGVPSIDPAEVFLQPLEPDELELLRARLPWIDEPLFKADAVGVIEAEDPGEIDELARDLGLDDESAEWLKELLDEDDDLLP